MQPRHTKLFYFLLLLSVCIIWGFDPCIYSYFYKFYSASVLCTICTGASLIFFLLVSIKKLKNLNIDYLKTAIPISFLNSLAGLLQRIGLQYTTPANYAFLEHLSCVAVPVMMYIFIRKKPDKTQMFACLVCLSGCLFLNGINLNSGTYTGNILCALSGILYGICTAAIGVYAQKLDALLYMTLYLLTYFIMSILSTLIQNNITVNGNPIETPMFSFDGKLLLAAMLFGVISVGVTWLMRTLAIQHIEPSAVAVISPFSAIIAAISSVILGTDKLTLNFVIGSILVLAATIISGVNNTKSESDMHSPSQNNQF